MKPEMKTIELELTRTIPASPIEAFDGWLDPKCPGTPWSEADKLILDPTVTFQKKGEDTLLTLRHENLPDDEYGRGHEKGWGYLLSRFADRFPRDRDQLA
jgi:hypothetical protein